ALTDQTQATTNNYVGSIAPHGGTLINRRLRGEMAEATREMASGLKTIVLSPMNISDLELITVGAFSPLTGFMGQADYLSVVNDMHLANGLPWTIPVTLPVDEETAGDIRIGQSIALAEPDDAGGEIGRASCRERGEIWADAVVVARTTERQARLLV